MAFKQESGTEQDQHTSPVHPRLASSVSAALPTSSASLSPKSAADVTGTPSVAPRRPLWRGGFFPVWQFSNLLPAAKD